MSRISLTTSLLAGLVLAVNVFAGPQWTPQLKVTGLNVYQMMYATDIAGDAGSCTYKLSGVSSGREPISALEYPARGQYVIVKLSNNSYYGFPLTSDLNGGMFTTFQQAMAGSKFVQVSYDTDRKSCFQLAFGSSTDARTPIYAVATVP